MNASGATVLGCLKHLFSAQIGLCRWAAPDVKGLVRQGQPRRVRVRIRVDGHSAQPHGPGGSQDVCRDLAAVGDKKGVQTHGESFAHAGTRFCRKAVVPSMASGLRAAWANILEAVWI